MKKVYVIGYGSYGIPFKDLGHDVQTLPLSTKSAYPLDADLLVFAGGEDIHPELYHDKNIASSCGNRASERDRIEEDLYNYAMFNHIPMVGICRGMQLGTALGGGKLYQDVTNHDGRGHLITDLSGYARDLYVNSLHHQMCILPKHIEMLAYAKLGGRKIGSAEAEELDERPDLDVEAMYNPKHRFLGVQFHPEMLEKESSGRNYFDYLCDKYIWNQEKTSAA